MELSEIITGLLGAIVGAAVAAYFNRRQANLRWNREQEEAARDVIRQVLSTCYRRALFTPTIGHQDFNAMFASLAECRSELQSMYGKIRSSEHQRLVEEIISLLDFIEKRDFTKIPTEDLPPTYAGMPIHARREQVAHGIDIAKTRIIELLKRLRSEADVPFELRNSILDGGPLYWAYRGLEEANEPPDKPLQ
jgi:hypothetical protein